MPETTVSPRRTNKFVLAAIVAAALAVIAYFVATARDSKPTDAPSASTEEVRKSKATRDAMLKNFTDKGKSRPVPNKLP